MGKPESEIGKDNNVPNNNEQQTLLSQQVQTQAQRDAMTAAPSGRRRKNVGCDKRRHRQDS